MLELYICIIFTNFSMMKKICFNLYVKVIPEFKRVMSEWLYYIEEKHFCVVLSHIIC